MKSFSVTNHDFLPCPYQEGIFYRRDYMLTRFVVTVIGELPYQEFNGIGYFVPSEECFHQKIGSFDSIEKAIIRAQSFDSIEDRCYFPPQLVEIRDRSGRLVLAGKFTEHGLCWLTPPKSTTETLSIQNWISKRKASAFLMIRYGQSKISEDLLFQAYLEGFKLAVDPFWLSHALVALNNIEHSVQAIEVKQQSFYKSPYGEGIFYREDIFNSQLRVVFIGNMTFRDDDGIGSYDRDTHHTAGECATIEEAISIASKFISDDLSESIYDEDSISPFNPKMVVIRDRKNRLVLAGEVKSSGAISWLLPPESIDQVVLIKASQRALSSEACEETRWDNHCTSKDLSFKAALEEYKLVDRFWSRHSLDALRSLGIN